MLMLSVLLLVFQYKPVQTWAAKKVAAHFAKQWHTEVHIGGLYIKPFSAVVLDSLYVLDLHKDTLINTPKLTVNLNGFSIFSSISDRIIDFSLIQLDNGSVYLKKQKDGTSNLDFILNSFKSTDTTAVKKPGKPWTIKFEQIAVNNLRFRYKNHLHDTLITNSIKFNDLDINRLTADVRDMDVVNHIFKADVRRLTLHEKSGFFIKEFKAKTTVDTNRILVQNMLIVTPNSLLKDYFSMRFKSFDDMGDFENKVKLDANFKSSQISSGDIAFFTSSLDKVKFDLGVDGRIKGQVNNLKASHLKVTAGQATYLSGDFDLKGLPDWDNTLLDLHFNQTATNKKDLDYLYNRFSGTTNRQLPAVIEKFGNVNFNGKITGKQSDITATGEFKTKLGRIVTDINLKTNKPLPAYSGKISVFNFDLGALAGAGLGRTTLVLNANGSGDELKNITEKLNASITYIEYNKYRYKNLALNGTVLKKVFIGNVNLNDNNVKLNLKGSVDLNPAKPAYNLTANITNARLNTLHLLKDTITLTANLNTQFVGNNLNNLTGKIALMPIRIVDPRHNYVVDSVTLSASGTGRERLISLQSPLADGSIKGNYDLATLPSYFKTIVKRYIPSLKTQIVPFSAQQFDFNFKIKNIDPVTALFSPDLKIPDQGTFIGQFNSADKTATLNGYVKTINYGGIVFHDLILDESTNDNFMGVNISLKKIDLSKELFIKDINVTNFLKNDSLNFNVKLADKDATNQLDLYGLVQFGRDTTAKLLLLPSDVILEHQPWKINNKVRIRLLDGKTQVSGFELANGQQKVRIDGYISDNKEDKLKVGFERFSMMTLDQLTKSSGITLRGSLNGDVVLSAITKSPGVDTQLSIDSLMMNETTIGNVKLVSTLDNERSQADVKLNILNRGLETLNITGRYKLGKEVTDPLDFNVKMNQTEAIIFDPFVKDLVSNLKGTISTDLKLTGTLSEPQLNGKLTLVNTGVTVNYLKTAYTINDEVTVKNSVINLNKMILKDIRGNQAIATGTIDLKNLSNPDIEINVDAKNFMALNTTFKDNHVYYGIAYGTGKFSFSGPTDNLNIVIKASTEEGTVFNIPLNTSSTTSDYDFINFVSHTDTTTQVFNKVNAFKGVTLGLELNVDEKSLVKISTDYGRLEGRGVANNLKLNINSLGDFEMYGDFQISSGKFEFTAKDFISKNFTINQGGTIRWTSNPSNADINLKAIYEVRTGIANLYTAAGLTSAVGNPQKLVQAELILTNTLQQPKIDFNFSFPTDPSIKDDLATYLNDESNRSQQALSLIVRRQFSNGTGSNLTNQVAQTAGEAVSEFAFNKLNTLISQSNIKNVDVNIRSTSDASATLRFFHDRLLFSGSLYNSNGSNNLFNGIQTTGGTQGSNANFFNSDINSFTKDFEADFLLRADGRLRARYSYRVLNSTTINSFNNNLAPQYINGVGLVYQRDFDTFGEFLRSLFIRRRKPLTPTVKTTDSATYSQDSPDDK